MRRIVILFAIATISITLGAAPPPKSQTAKQKTVKARVNAKEDEDRLAEVEKAFAAMEPALSKEKWAVQTKKTMTELLTELKKMDRIDVFRLNPKRLPNKGKGVKGGFHGYEILAEVRAEPADRRKEIAAFVENALHWNQLRMALCFNPRHGLRFSSTKRTLDFLICFECYRVQVYEGDEFRSSFALSRSKINPIEQILGDVEKKLKE